MVRRRVLISTLPPFGGGVPAKTRILVGALRDAGHDVTVAYYATFAHGRDLCVPAWMLPALASPTLRRHEVFDGVPAVAVGSWMPELEFLYHRLSSRWRGLIADHDRHIAVGGTVLVSHPFLEAGIPHLVWCASGVTGDRAHRRGQMPLARRAVDAAIIEPRLLAMEQDILSGPATIRGVSRYTCRSLEELGLPAGRAGVMPIPTDPELFRPPPCPAPAGVVGFAARFEDPRKNLPLLLEAVALARRQGAELRLRLAGTQPSQATLSLVRRLDLGQAVEFAGELGQGDLPGFYGGLDVFAIPSGQEGFCIAGIEAMACGVPVVSTRCGGPEDYVVPGETGYLVPENPADLAEKLALIAGDRGLRQRLGAQARASAVSGWSPAGFAAALRAAWAATWPGEEATP